jgi:phage gpG-like protein
MINVNVDAADVLSGMQNILDNGQNLPMDEIAQILLESVQRNFEEEGRPSKWDARKDPGDGHPLLNDTGNLIDSLEANVVGDIAYVTAGASYAGYLNEGTSRMVARPFLLVQDEDMDAIEELLAKHFS